ncbi:hypothetical protein KAU08_07755 [bacterium]|nr:hypothetical protein [bacterium]
MKINNILSIGLLVFVAISVAVMIANASHSNQSDDNGSNEVPAPIETGTQALPTMTEPENGTAETQALLPDRLTVYYFHGRSRCGPCTTLERYAREAVANNFADSVENGTIEWRVVNIDQPGNVEFVEKYLLYTQSVIVSEIRDGTEVRWKNLDKIWALVNTESEYKTYIHDEVSAWMEDNG